MGRSGLSSVLLGVGWVMYAASLLSPAVAVVAPRPGNSFFDVGTIGFLCLVVSFGLALVSPLSFACALSNILMLASLALPAWAERVPRRASVLFFSATCAASCLGLFGDFHALLAGYWLWLGSFITVGVAFLVRPAHPERGDKPLTHVTQSSATAIEYGDSNFRENN